MATKKCPFCAEEILQEAIKCKHCHESLTPLNAESTPSCSPATKSKAEQRKAEQAAAPAVAKAFFRKYWIVLTVTTLLIVVACAFNGAIADSLVGLAALAMVILFFAIFLSPWRFKIIAASLWLISICLYSAVYGFVPAETKAKEAAAEQAQVVEERQEQDQQIENEQAKVLTEKSDQKQQIEQENAEAALQPSNQAIGCQTG